MVSFGYHARTISEKLAKDKNPNVKEIGKKNFILHTKHIPIILKRMTRSKFNKLSQQKLKFGKKHQFLVIEPKEEPDLLTSAGLIFQCKTVILKVRISLYDVSKGFLLPNIFGNDSTINDNIGIGIQDDIVFGKDHAEFQATKRFCLSPDMKKELLNSAYQRGIKLSDITSDKFPFNVWMRMLELD